MQSSLHLSFHCKSFSTIINCNYQYFNVAKIDLLISNVLKVAIIHFFRKVTEDI